MPLCAVGTFLYNHRMPDIKIEKTYLLGFYNSQDYYFAHLYEHFLAVYLGGALGVESGALGVRVNSANCGAGYIFLEIQADRNKVDMVIDLINSGAVDIHTVTHERDIAVSENLLHNRIETYRDIYESLETDSGTVTNKDALFEIFRHLPHPTLIKKISEVMGRIKWLFIAEKDIQSYSGNFTAVPPPKETKFTFFKVREKNEDFPYTEIDLVIHTGNKLDDFLMNTIHDNLIGVLNDTTRVFTAHKINGAIFETWNKRMVLHYASYMPWKRQSEFFETVREKYVAISEDLRVGKRAKAKFRDYCDSRTSREAAHELAKYGLLSSKSGKMVNTISQPVYYKRLTS